MGTLATEEFAQVSLWYQLVDSWNLSMGYFIQISMNAQRKCHVIEMLSVLTQMEVIIVFAILASLGMEYHALVRTERI